MTYYVSISVLELVIVWKRFAGKTEMFYPLEGFRFVSMPFLCRVRVPTNGLKEKVSV